MAEIAVFEDQEVVISRIHRALSDTNHNVLVVAQDIDTSYAILRQLADNELNAGALLIDGSLKRGFAQSTFEYNFPVELKDAQLNLFRNRFIEYRRRRPDVVVPPDPADHIMGRDGRQIVAIIRALNLHIPTIGISGNPMVHNRTSVDYDITKIGISTKLVPLLDYLDTGIVAPNISELVRPV